MLIAVIVVPLFFSAVAWLLPSHRLRSLMLPVASGLHLILSIMLISQPLIRNHGWLGLDDLSRLVLLVTGLLFFACAVYGFDYLNLRNDRDNHVMVSCLLIFLSAMTLAVLSRHLGLLWVAVETTTIASAPLIYFNRNALSIEATWKYLLICSVGIALAMLGILFVGYAALGNGPEVSLQFDTLLVEAPHLAGPWLHAGFVFLLVGFGTKMGLAPLHTWKPDAYGEAPGLVGALLAGGLTSVAFLAILRGVQLMGAAGDLDMARHALLGMGLLSLTLAAIFVIRQTDIKRMLAFSSVEHMGILAIGVGIGGLATFGAMLHLINNALTKGSLFLTAGNIHRAYASKKKGGIRGAMSRLPLSGSLFLAGFLAITGSPPFGPFLSEFTILRGIFGAENYIIGALALIFLATVFIGMGSTVLAVTQGETDPTLKDNGFRDRLLLVAPPLLLLLIVLMLGLYLPEPLSRLLHGAAALIEVQP